MSFWGVDVAEEALPVVVPVAEPDQEGQTHSLQRPDGLSALPTSLSSQEYVSVAVLPPLPLPASDPDDEFNASPYIASALSQGEHWGVALPELALSCRACEF